MYTDNKLAKMNPKLLDAATKVMTEKVDLSGVKIKKDSLVSAAMSVLNLTESEQLDELSKDTLKSYSAKAKESEAGTHKKGRASKAALNTRAKRIAGLEAAAKKLSDIRTKEFTEASKRRHAERMDLHNHFHKEAPAILKKHGYTKIASSDTKDTYVRPHESGHINSVTLMKQRPDDWHARHTLTSSTGWSGGSHQIADHYTSDEHKKVKAEMMPKFEHDVISAHNHHHMNESFNLDIFSEEELETLDALLEDVDQLDELSKATLGKYVHRALNDVRNSNQARVRWNSNKTGFEGNDPKGNYVKKTSKEMEDEHAKLAKKREGGIRLAVNKLAKEDVDLLSQEELDFIQSHLESDTDD